MFRNFTLVFTLSLLVAVAVHAHLDTPLARHASPAAVHRMVRKRSPQLLGNSDPAAKSGNRDGVVNAAPAAGDDSNTETVTPPGRTTNSATPVVAPSNTATNRVATPSPAANTANTQATPSNTVSTSGGLLSPLVGGLLGSSSTTSTSSSISSTPTSTSTSTSTTPTPTSTSTTPTSTTPTATPTQENQTIVPSKVTITSSQTPTPTQAPDTKSGSVTKLQRNTIIILIAIGASIGAAGLIWTVIRKWKFRPSSSFEDRMQPIDWQPTTGAGVGGERDMTERLSRNNSTRSHGSFTSAGNHGGYAGSGSGDHHLTVDLPPHDFTAGPAHLAPVGGYADLQRGPSPQPDMQRGPSFRSPSPYQYDVPNPHAHGGYYNGGYQGGYEHNRGY